VVADDEGLKVEAFSREWIKKIFLYLDSRTVTRMSLEKRLRPLFPRINGGRVLDIGSKDSPYKSLIRFDEYVRMDVSQESHPDICCDVHDIKAMDQSFDAVIATELLEHCYNPQKALNEIYRVLKDGGICLLSTRFMYRYHPDPKDYYRFTRDSLEMLFGKFRSVEVYEHGNKVQVLWQILCSGWLKIFLTPLNGLVALIDYRDVKTPLGFVVFAKK